MVHEMQPVVSSTRGQACFVAIQVSIMRLDQSLYNTIALYLKKKKNLLRVLSSKGGYICLFFCIGHICQEIDFDGHFAEKIE